MSTFGVYEVDVSYEAEDQRCGVDGWVSGYAPGNGRFRPAQKETFRVVATRQSIATGYVLGLFESPDYREVGIVSVRAQRVDAVVVVH